jgi:hypothetical protein
MLNQLFEKFPEHIAFQILTYRPHPDAELISDYWNIRRQWSYVVRQVKIMNREMHWFMEQEEVNDTFYNWYMYGESPYSDDNTEREMNRVGGWGEWYRQ